MMKEIAYLFHAHEFAHEFPKRARTRETACRVGYRLQQESGALFTAPTRAGLCFESLLTVDLTSMHDGGSSMIFVPIYRPLENQTSAHTNLHNSIKNEFEINC